MARLGAVLTATALAAPATPVSGQSSPEMLGAEVISTDVIEYGPSFSPSGDTLYFTRRASFGDAPRIHWSVREGEGWTTPRAVSFAHGAGDEFPFVTADGSRLYFSSARPVGGVDQRDRNDLWYVDRTPDGWSEPIHIGGELSTPDVDSHPVVMGDRLFFHSRREGGAGGVDAYSAGRRGGSWRSPELLPFNSAATDGEVAPTPDGAGAVFYSDRDGGRGRGDLYFVPREGSAWGEPENLATLNTEAWEWSPAFHPDGRLVFARLSAAGDRSDLYIVRLR